MQPTITKQLLATEFSRAYCKDSDPFPSIVALFCNVNLLPSFPEPEQKLAP